MLMRHNNFDALMKQNFYLSDVSGPHSLLFGLRKIFIYLNGVKLICSKLQLL